MSGNNDKKTIKITVICVAAAVVLIAAGAIVFGASNNKDKDKDVKTEIGLTPKGEIVVMNGTSPDGEWIEAGTYADGRVAEAATDSKGEAATNASGAYVINYPKRNSSSGSSSANGGGSPNTKAESRVNASSKNAQEGSSDNKKSSEIVSDNSKSESSVKSSSSSKATSSSKSTASSKTTSSSKSTSSGKPASSSKAASSSKTDSSSSSGSGSTPSSQVKTTTAVINGTSYNVGDKIRVSFYMQCSQKFLGINAITNYDSKILKVETPEINMPNLTGSMSNTDLENEFRMTASSAMAIYDFSSEKLLASCDFTIKNVSPDPTNITMNIVELLDNDINNISPENYSIRVVTEKL